MPPFSTYRATRVFKNTSVNCVPTTDAEAPWSSRSYICFNGDIFLQISLTFIEASSFKVLEAAGLESGDIYSLLCYYISSHLASLHFAQPPNEKNNSCLFLNSDRKKINGNKEWMLQYETLRSKQYTQTHKHSGLLLL